MASLAIILNGTSSSGKTSIAQEIQRQWKGPILHVAVDDFLAMLGDRYPDNQANRNNAIMFCIANHYAFLRRFRNSEFPAIVDTVLWQDEFRTETLAALEGIPLFLVGVKCSLGELERREKERGDRNLGIARKQYLPVHKDFQYDLEIDTEAVSATQAAASIISRIRVKFPDYAP